MRCTTFLLGGLWLLLSLLTPPFARAGTNTYCVGAPQHIFMSGECDSRAVRALHPVWHFHVFVSDGESCFECFDERDDTCETDFLRNHPEWTQISGKGCVAVGHAPTDEGVKFHVIAGKDVSQKPDVDPSRGVSVKSIVTPKRLGPFSVGDEARFDVSVQVGAGELRPFEQGDLVLSDAESGAELSRFPVKNLGAGKGVAFARLPRRGRVRATFDVGGVVLRPGEVEVGRDHTHWVLRVSECRLRAAVRGQSGSFLLGGDSLAVRGEVVDRGGGVADPDTLVGRPARFVLRREDGTEESTAAQLGDQGLEASIRAPIIKSGSESATVQLVVDGEPEVCPGDPLPVTLSHLPLTLEASGPDTCWTDRPCEFNFSLGRPESGLAASRAEELLKEPGLEVIARLGGRRVETSRKGDVFTVVKTPTTQGRLHGELELLWSGTRSLAAEISVDVEESIELVLPDAISLGAIEGGSTLSSTCAPLSFAEGKGSLGSRFSVELAEPCGNCEAEVVSVVQGQVFDLPLDEVVIGADQELPICLRVARCPTGLAGGSQELILRPLEPLFQDQERRVTVQYTVKSRGLFDCWDWLLRWLGGALVLAVILYGWIRPQGFEPGSSIRLASSEKGLRRAPRLLLEEEPGGRTGWYRSACVYVDAGGATTRRRRDALFSCVPSGGGVTVRSHSGIERQDRRTRKMEPIDTREVASGTALQRGRLYRVGDLLIKAGG